MEFRSYHSKDKVRILEIFRSNFPKYFVECDALDLIDFLDNYADENYLVVIENGKIIGSGGHYTKSNMHGIAWVMFERNLIGHKNLLKFSDEFFNKIEDNIKGEGKYFPVSINTTQLMEKLFKRYGFETVEVIDNGFGKGLDEYKMTKKFQRENNHAEKY
ncbi:hypothetical protein [Flexithrix dorotheae]|uniref:hypothetical protein n=1 Tax=Flexithrix dorotheae TaxID=70993 RepID=UPI0003619247|nr:hypothetical protein [Flexithrix dorotheae]